MTYLILFEVKFNECRFKAGGFAQHVAQSSERISRSPRIKGKGRFFTGSEPRGQISRAMIDGKII